MSYPASESWKERKKEERKKERKIKTDQQLLKEYEYEVKKDEVSGLGLK